MVTLALILCTRWSNYHSYGHWTRWWELWRNWRTVVQLVIITSHLNFSLLPHVAQALHSLFQHIWSSGRVHVEWKDGIIVSLHKGKGPKNKCSSYNLSLFLYRTVLSHVLLERI